MVCLLVADGMGGHAHGERASYLAVRTIQADLGRDIAGAKPGEQLCRTLVLAAHEAVCKVNDGATSGTTITLALIHGTRCYVANVGDSRLYLLRDGMLTQITDDDTWDAEAKRRGMEPTANESLTQAVGVGSTVTVSTKTLDLVEKDAIVLCSDGLYKMVDHGTIARIILGAPTVDEAAASLVSAARARGGEDNVTVCMARLSNQRVTASKRPPALLIAALAVLALLSVAAIAMQLNRSAGEPSSAPPPQSTEERPQTERSVRSEQQAVRIKHLKDDEEVKISWDGTGRAVYFEPWILESHFDDKKLDATMKIGLIEGDHHSIRLKRWDDWLVIRTSTPMRMYVDDKAGAKSNFHHLKFSDAPKLSWHVGGKRFRLGARK